MKPTFEFLERGARKEAVAIRHWMQDWFAAYPEDHREELRRRLQLKSFREFMAAHFELQVFAMLCRLGCRVEIHPKFTDTRGTVDFRAGHGNDTFYVEALLSHKRGGRMGLNRALSYDWFSNNANDGKEIQTHGAQ